MKINEKLVQQLLKNPSTKKNIREMIASFPYNETEVERKERLKGAYSEYWEEMLKSDLGKLQRNNINMSDIQKQQYKTALNNLTEKIYDGLNHWFYMVCLSILPQKKEIIAWEKEMYIFCIRIIKLISKGEYEIDCLDAMFKKVREEKDLKQQSAALMYGCIRLETQKLEQADNYSVFALDEAS